MARQPKLALIDAHALIHRAYHALPPMSLRDGTPTNAVYGFTTMFLKMMSSLKPTHVIAAFDEKGPTFRSEEFAAYKAHRKAVDQELIAQFDLVRKILRAFDVPILSKQGFEADDVIGTIVTQLEGKAQTVIVTGDMDTLQLVDHDTAVFTLKRGIADTILYTPALVREKYGFDPEFVTDYKGLRGDPSDNIPGVKGVGEKTAKELVAQFGSIENIYKHLEEVSSRARSRLEGQQEAALFSKRLATIRRDVPISFHLDEAQFDTYDPEKVRQALEEFEFRSLISRLPKIKEIQPSLLRTAANQAPVALPEHYHLVATADEKQALKKLLAQESLIAFDTETEFLGARLAPIVGMSFARKSGKQIEAWYVPVTRPEVADWREVLENPKIHKVGHNLKYDIEVLQQSQVVLQGVVFDSMIASYLLHPGARQHSLDTLAVQELGHHCIPLTDLIGTGKTQKKVSAVPLDELARYACEDADISLQMYEVLRPRIEAEDLEHVLADLEIPLIRVLADMELAGVQIDEDKLEKLHGRVSRRLEKLQKAIWQAAGQEFNINSPTQLREVLFESLQLPTTAISRTQSGYSTAAAELAKLHGQHPIIEMLEEYRELAKLENTYIKRLPELVDQKTGRLYASFNQTVAATGRLSSSDANLQNIPVRTQLGQEIRAAFVSRRGYRFIKADYSQIELRLAAHMSQDDAMIQAFRQGEDIHTATAAWVHGVKIGEVTDKQRRAAKTLNFGVLYGMGPQSFARAADISLEEARSFIGRYREKYAKLTDFIEQTIELAREQGFVTTLFGRKRYLPEINSGSPGIRAQAERMAFNFPIQGTAADILKKAMIELHAALAADFPEAQLVLTVHDELVVEAPAKQAAALAARLKRIMENIYALDVPLIVDVATGPNWKELTPLVGK